MWVTFTCDENGRTLSGTDVLAALIVMQGMGVDAFGLNCSSGPAEMLEQMRRLTPYTPSRSLPSPTRACPRRWRGRRSTTAAGGVRLLRRRLRGGRRSYLWRLLRHYGGACGPPRSAVEAVDFSASSRPGGIPM